eukprot:12113306-Heterocapsa_arctica.AAC.1
MRAEGCLRYAQCKLRTDRQQPNFEDHSSSNEITLSLCQTWANSPSRSGGSCHCGERAAGTCTRPAAGEA